MFADATGGASDGEERVKAEAEVAEIASIAAPATAASVAAVRMRVIMVSSTVAPGRPRIVHLRHERSVNG